MVALAEESASYKTEKLADGSASRSPRDSPTLRLYGHRKVTVHAVVKFHPDGGAGQELPSLMTRIVVRRSDELEEPSA
jgi:hypothetical protein